MSVSITQHFSRFLGMHEGLEFSRGSAGLYALLSAVADRYGYGEVILPSLCCESVALAVLYSGHKPRFSDVSPDTLSSTVDSVEAICSEKTRAVLIAHLFGIDAQMGQFDGLRRKYPDVAFIEDIAHAIGGRSDGGVLLGGQLDYTLMSFAQDKILPGDGGIILVSEGAAITAAEITKKAPCEKSLVPNGLALSLRNLVHAAGDLWRTNTDFDMASIFLPASNYYRSIIVSSGGIGDPAKLLQALESLDENRSGRIGKQQFYAEFINTAKVLPMDEAGVCWRCPILFDGVSEAQLVTTNLRKYGHNASNHYLPLHLLFGVDTCPVSEYIALRIVNLWVDEAVTEKALHETVDIVNSK